MYLITLGVGMERMQQFITVNIAYDLDLLAGEIAKHGVDDVYYLRIVNKESGNTLLDASPCYMCEPCQSCQRRGAR